jgi:AraC-like DNA-binding protein
LVHLYGFFFFYFEPPSYQLSLLDLSKIPPWHIKLIGLLIPVSGITYMIFTVKTALNYNKQIKNRFSNIEEIELSWLLYLVVGTFIIWLIVLISYFVGFVFGEELQANLSIYIAISIFLYTLAIKSYRQPQINMKEESSDSYKKSGLAEDKAKEYLDKLISVMENEKLFLDPTLNLNQLSEKLNISTHNISEVINTKQKQNFYDFINSYRVEEVKKLISKDSEAKYNLLAHGFEAGFSSKSAYYSAFKKFTSLTPSQDYF